MSAMTYEQRRAQVLELLAEGMTLRQIADRLDLSYVHVKRVASNGTSYESTLRASRVVKQRRVGACEDCGAQTRYNGHTAVVSRFCFPCASVRNGVAARGTGSTQARVLAFIGDGEWPWDEIRVGAGMTKGTAANVLHRMLRFGLLERPRRGVYRKATRDVDECAPFPRGGV